MTKQLLALGLMLSLSGCASVAKGTNQNVQFISEPVEATVKVYDILQDHEGGECITPCSLKLDRRGVYRAIFEKEGHSTKKIKIRPEYSTSGLAGGASSYVLTLGIGVGVDAITGAMKDLEPNPVKARLIPIKKSEPET